VQSIPSFVRFLHVYLLEINVIAASHRSIWLPVDNCFYAQCPYVIANKPLKLQGASERNVILYTASEGAIAAKYFHITCDGRHLDLRVGVIFL
jgi:hypothetical protein